MTYVCTEKATISEWLKEIEQLKEKLALTENDRDEWYIKAEDLMKENKRLQKELNFYKPNYK